MTVGIVVVVVVIVALGWWRSGSQNISINMYIIRKIYCVKLPTVYYQANRNQHIACLAICPYIYRSAYGLIGF
jgi:hypothetical protein